MNDFGQDMLALFQRCITSGVMQYLQKANGVKVRRGVYSAQVVLWLMISQRLPGWGTLAAAVQFLLAGGASGLLDDCLRVREKRISSRTGAYSRARLRLPTILCRQVTNELAARLRQILNPEQSRAVYLLDGSSVELEASPRLLKTYPAAQNQHGSSHFPVVRMVVLHDLETGLAEEPRWGPMYGAAAVSEQALSEKVMDAVPKGSILLGDRNFGVFSVALAAKQRGHDVIVRLKDDRARKVAGGPIGEPGERAVVWKPSAAECRRHGFARDTMIAGRLIAARVGRGKTKQWLYLFTTVTDLDREKIVEIYGRRWNIETDLRSLKRTVRLHHVAAQSEAMMEKDLLTAIAAYNLVRAVMALAARRHRLEPRQLSFTFVLNVVQASLHRLVSTPPGEQYDRELDSMLDRAAQGNLPRRPKPRSFPRAVWHHRHDFPARKVEK
jgi:hypothetical protein